jgi:hypothetical protein
MYLSIPDSMHGGYSQARDTYFYPIFRTPYSNAGITGGRLAICHATTYEHNPTNGNQYCTASIALSGICLSTL